MEKRKVKQEHVYHGKTLGYAKKISIKISWKNIAERHVDFVQKKVSLEDTSIKNEMQEKFEQLFQYSRNLEPLKHSFRTATDKCLVRFDRFYLILLGT